MTYKKTITVLAVTAGALACSAALLPGSASAEDKQLTIAMITHAEPGDTFWDIIRKGANAAAAKDHVKLLYLAAPEGPCSCAPTLLPTADWRALLPPSCRAAPPWPVLGRLKDAERRDV